MAEKHTPTPWKIDANGIGCRSIKGGKCGTHKQAQYTEIACTVGLFDDAVDRANAEFIVRTCNSHAALLTALEGLARLYEDDEGCKALPEYIAARAAIAQAKGE